MITTSFNIEFFSQIHRIIWFILQRLVTLQQLNDTNICNKWLFGST